MCYRLSHHAQWRIHQRRLTAEELLAALEGKCVRQRSGNVLLCDPKSRCAVVIDLQYNLVVTAMRLKPSKYKRIFSRKR